MIFLAQDGWERASTGLADESMDGIKTTQVEVLSDSEHTSMRMSESRWLEVRSADGWAERGLEGRYRAKYRYIRVEVQVESPTCHGTATRACTEVGTWDLSRLGVEG